MELGRELRFATRHLAKNGQFTVVAVLTLALGIGSGAVIYSVVHTLLVRPPT